MARHLLVKEGGRVASRDVGAGSQSGGTGGLRELSARILVENGSQQVQRHRIPWRIEVNTGI
jgi:hypothetical protein